MKKHFITIKNLFIVIFLLTFHLVQGQWQWRFNLNYATPQLRNERCNSGIKTVVNYAGGNPNAFYYVGIGTSYNNTALPVPPNGSNRLRFIRVNNAGTAILNNLGHQFTDSIGKYFHSAGHSIAEVSNGAGTGGYVAVGAVANNSISGANTIAGRSDILFARLSTTGTVLTASHIDLNNGGIDTAWCIRKSVVTYQGSPTWILCGQSTKDTRTDCVVARVLANGTIVWCYTYNFDPDGAPYNTAQCIAKQLCETTNGNIYVVGTLRNNGAVNTDGLAFALNPAGNVIWANNYDAASDDEFQAVRVAANGNLIVGGFTNFGVAAPVTHNMLIVQLAPAAGAIVFQQRLIALANNGIAQFTSKCYDIVQGINGQFYLAGLVVRNGVNAEMLYRTNQNGVGLSWNSYNTMLYNVGFGIDRGGPDTSIIYFASLKNLKDTGFSDSHIMKINSIGGTCNFCEVNKPRTTNIDLKKTFREGLRRDVCASRLLKWQTFDYDEKLICNTKCPQTSNNNISMQPQEAKPSTSTSNGLRVSPNPVVSTLHVQLNSLSTGAYQITLTDMQGRVMMQTNSIHNGKISSTYIDMSSFASGVYLLTVKQGALMLQQKVLKE
jgi:hypothetical protein